MIKQTRNMKNTESIFKRIYTTTACNNTEAEHLNDIGDFLKNWKTTFTQKCAKLEKHI